MRDLPTAGATHARFVHHRCEAYVTCPPQVRRMRGLSTTGARHTRLAHRRCKAYVACPPQVRRVRDLSTAGAVESLEHVLGDRNEKKAGMI